MGTPEHLTNIVINTDYTQEIPILLNFMCPGQWFLCFRDGRIDHVVQKIYIMSLIIHTE